MNRRWIKILTYVLAFIVIVVLILVWNFGEKSEPTQNTTKQPTATPEVEIQDGWKVFTKDNIKFRYPSEWQSLTTSFPIPNVKTYPEPDGFAVEHRDNSFDFSAIYGILPGRNPSDNDTSTNEDENASIIETANGYTAEVYKVDTEIQKVIMAIISHPNPNVKSELSISIIYQPTNSEVEELFDEILSSVEFVD